MPETTPRKYPFKFLDSYNRNDTDIFFGRDEEIKALYEMVSQNSMVLLYGASGTGKTSLIQCGLAGKFKSYDWLPLMVRRGGNINASLEKSLIDAGGNSESFDSELEDINENQLTGFTRLVKGVYLNNFKTSYFIFDQFEELYILGTRDEEDKFIEAIKEILAAGQPVKFIFSIREEYLGYLYRFEKIFPQLLRKKLRVEPMANENLKDILTGINHYRNSCVRIDARYLDSICEGIFEKLRGDNKTLTIELPYLQVLMDKLYLDITKDKEYKTDALITLESVNQLDNLGNVLKKFLEGQVEQVKVLALHKNIATNNISTDTIWKILSPFATLEGTKEPALKNEIEERIYGKDIDRSLVNFCIDEFVNRRVINFSEETTRYELTHDSLAKCIAGKRTDEDIRLLEIRRLVNHQAAIKEGAREFFSEKQLKIITPYLAKLKLNDDEKALVEQSQQEVATAIKKRRTKRNIVLMIAMLAVAFISWLFINQNRKEADNTRMAKLSKLRQQISSSFTSQKKLLPFLYTLEALTLEKDASAYKSLIEKAKKWNAYPAYVLEKIYFGSSSKISRAMFGDNDSIVYLLDNQSNTLKAWNYKMEKVTWSGPARLESRESDNSLIGENGLLFFSRLGNSRDSLSISDSSIYFVKMYIDSVVANLDITGLPVLPEIINKIYGASFSNDRQNVLIWGKNAESIYDAVGFWDNENNNNGMSLVHDGITGAAFSADKKKVLTWDDSTVRVWNYVNDSSIFKLTPALLKLKGQVETGLEISPIDNSSIQVIPPLEYHARREEYLRLYKEYLEKQRK